ncbi:PP0621 family protein [Hydrogenophaga sp. 5NK40-0174]|uniref:PP0621 family protein n=1 Tax=Hydrogenophaga sp. 5NK40-0174 TaxID=3127649 RepID=UPI003102FD78
MMKYLLLAVVLGVAWWMWRKNHVGQASTTHKTAPAGRSHAPVAMVACAHCGTHLPQSEAVRGKDAYFCDPSHRAAHERQG